MRFRGDVTLTYTADVFCFTHFLSGFLDASSHLYKRVRPSVGPSIGPLVRYACAKTAIFGCFWPRRDPTLNLLRDKHVLRASVTTFDGRLSVLPSVYPYMSHDQYTQRHSPDASLPVWACYLG